MSKSRKTFYITTPIYYVNGAPHIGHTYTTIAADVLARYHRVIGDDVFFLTGTDENAQKNVEAAQKDGKGVQRYVDEMASVWRETWLTLGISFDRFIRTTSPEHKKAVYAFFDRVHAQGDIYMSDYEGLYCSGCEAFVTESDLTSDGFCPDHLKEPEHIKEKNYFFKASRYRDQLLEHIASHPDFVQPASRRNEIINYITHHFDDVSITRQTMEWGIPLPIDESHVIYVWFDALLNYFSGIGYAQDEVKFETFWPADVQLMAKDIIKFHCAIWPAMLMSAGYSLPKKIFAHGYFTVEGEKISKSLGNVIDPVKLTEEYPFDVIRYFFMREIPFGEDGVFSFDRLKQRYNADLANDLGNLVQRTLTMIDTYLDGVIDREHRHDSPVHFDKVGLLIDDFRFDIALQEIWQGIAWGNKFIEDQKPWKLAKEDSGERLQEVLARVYALLAEIMNALMPFMPETAERLRVLLDADRLCAPDEPLFPRKL